MICEKGTYPNCDIWCKNNQAALKFGRHFSSNTAERPTKFRAIGQLYTPISRLRVFLWSTVVPMDALWYHDDVIKWKHFPRYWPFVGGIHRSPVNSHKGQWRGALMFSLICVWINVWVNNRGAGDLRRYRAHYDVIVMLTPVWVNDLQGHGW